MKPLVLFYTAILTNTGGGQHAMSLLAEELVARGYDIVIFTRPPFNPHHRYARMLMHLGIRICVLSRLHELWFVQLGVVLSRLLLVIPYAILRRRNFRFSWQAAGSICLTWIASLERRYIRKRLDKSAQGRSNVILHIWGPAALTPLLLECAHQRAMPAIYHEMGEADEQYVETWQLQATVSALDRAQAVICCSRSVAENIRRVYKYRGPIKTVPFMIREPGENWVQSRNGRLNFGAIGRLVPHKRHCDLIQALKQLCDEGYDVGLVIAGSGPLKESLHNLSCQLGVQDRVTLTGEFDDLDDVMAQLDVFALMSSSESQCMPITESMAYGKPVIAGRFGGIPDFVEDGITGYLVPVGDVASLTCKLRVLLEHRDLREEMGRKGRERYLQLATREKIVDAIESTYCELEGLERTKAQELEERTATGLRLGYFVECYPSFVVSEILELRKLGAVVKVFNAFRPAPHQDPMQEEVRKDSLYFADSYLSVVTAVLRTIVRSPLRFARLLAFVIRHGESLRLLLLAVYYSPLIRQEGVQHLHGTFGTRTTTLAYLASSLSGIDYSFTTHAYDLFNPNPSLVWKTNGSRFMRTISHFNKRFAEATYLGVNGSKIIPIYLGVDPDRFKPMTSRQDGGDECKIASVGDLIEKKGHSYAIQACERLYEDRVPFSLEIIGEGPLHHKLQTEIEERGLDKCVQLLGKLKNDDVRLRLSRSQIFVLACIDVRATGDHMDGIPVALMEAMAMGMPVVSTTVSGIPELIEDGVSGLLVPERDESALADALKKLIENGDLRRALGRGARQCIEHRFNISINTRELAAMFAAKRATR